MRQLEGPYSSWTLKTTMTWAAENLSRLLAYSACLSRVSWETWNLETNPVTDYCTTVSPEKPSKRGNYKRVPQHAWEGSLENRRSESSQKMFTYGWFSVPGGPTGASPVGPNSPTQKLRGSQNKTLNVSWQHHQLTSLILAAVSQLLLYIEINCTARSHRWKTSKQKIIMEEVFLIWQIHIILTTCTVDKFGPVDAVSAKWLLSHYTISH